MSDGKCSSYSVRAEAERRRRELEAARDRLARANDSARLIEISVAAANATYGLAISAPQTVAAQSSDAFSIEAAAGQVESEVNRIRFQMEEQISRVNTEQLRKAAREMLPWMRPSEPLEELKMRAAETSNSQPQATPNHAAEKAISLVERLPGDSAPQLVAECSELATSILEADAPSRQEVLLTRLRGVIQRDIERAKLTQKNRQVIDGLYRELDGLPGRGVAELRGELQALQLGKALPANLGVRVEQARDAANKQLDREFALEATKQALIAQGYELGEDFVTVAASEDGAYLPLAASRQHGVRVRERSGQLIMNVVRHRDRHGVVSDEDAAAAFCESHFNVTADLEKQGLSMTKIQHYDAGSGKIEVVEGKAPAQTQAVDDQSIVEPIAVEREREREA